MEVLLFTLFIFIFTALGHSTISIRKSFLPVAWNIFVSVSWALEITRLLSLQGTVWLVSLVIPLIISLNLRIITDAPRPQRAMLYFSIIILFLSHFLLFMDPVGGGWCPPRGWSYSGILSFTKNTTGKVHWAKERPHLPDSGRSPVDWTAPRRVTPWRDLLLTAYPEATVLGSGTPSSKETSCLQYFRQPVSRNGWGACRSMTPAPLPVKGTELCSSPYLKP